MISAFTDEFILGGMLARAGGLVGFPSYQNVLGSVQEMSHRNP